MAGIVDSTKDEFRCAIITRADVRDIEFALNQYFGAERKRRKVVSVSMLVHTS